MNTIRILTSSCVLLLYSCNNSLSVLNRKYRPGYTIEFSKTPTPQRTVQLPECISETVPVYNDEALIACVDQPDQPDQPQQHRKIPVVFKSVEPNLIQCQPITTKKTEKKIKRLLFSKRKKQLKPDESTTGKPLEPFNLVACFLIGAGILAGVLLHATGLLAVLLFLGTLALVLLFSLISARRMEKYPERYSKVSRILNYIFAICGIIVFVIFWIIIKTILAGE